LSDASQRRAVQGCELERIAGLPLVEADKPGASGRGRERREARRVPAAAAKRRLLGGPAQRLVGNPDRLDQARPWDAAALRQRNDGRDHVARMHDGFADISVVVVEIARAHGIAERGGIHRLLLPGRPHGGLGGARVLLREAHDARHRIVGGLGERFRSDRAGKHVGHAQRDRIGVHHPGRSRKLRNHLSRKAGHH
jgi:hypothetical protein